MPIVHIVLFKFKESTDPAVVKDVCEALTMFVLPDKCSRIWTQICNRMLGLKDTCLHPETKVPYMKSYGGGSNNSPEGAAVRASNTSNRVTLLTAIARPSVWICLRVPVRGRQGLLPEQGSFSSQVRGRCGQDRRFGHRVWLWARCYVVRGATRVIEVRQSKRPPHREISLNREASKDTNDDRTTRRIFWSVKLWRKPMQYCWPRWLATEFVPCQDQSPEIAMHFW